MLFVVRKEIERFRSQAFAATARSEANLAHDRWRYAICQETNAAVKARYARDFNHNCGAYSTSHTGQRFILFENRTPIKVEVCDV
jgi:hypothetical protein